MYSFSSSFPAHLRPIVLVGAIVFFMTAVTFASPPLYRLFCQVTGYGGTPRITTTQETLSSLAPLSPAPSSPTQESDIENTLVPIRARLVGDIDAALPWDFAPSQPLHTVAIGTQVRMTFVARNRSPKTTSGTATYNVIPAKAAPYIHKIACFCFNEQTLEGHQQVTMPFVIYIDPALRDDPLTRDIRTVTFAYRFFPSD